MEDDRWGSRVTIKMRLPGRGVCVVVYSTLVLYCSVWCTCGVCVNEVDGRVKYILDLNK